MSVPVGIVEVSGRPEGANVCWICAHPGATERDYHNYMQSLITMYGWAVQGVERDGIHPPWAYTVGLTRFRQPELVVTGMSLTKATAVLNGVAAHLVHADAPAPGTQGQEAQDEAEQKRRRGDGEPARPAWKEIAFSDMQKAESRPNIVASGRDGHSDLRSDQTLDCIQGP